MTMPAAVRPCVVLGVAVILAVSSSPVGAAPPRPPNIVFILADDLGWTDLGCAGSRYYETPQIDRLAAEGMRFTNHHHCQNCTPTRAALMSGQYGARTGVYTVGGIDRFDWSMRPLRPVENVVDLPLDRDTVADVLGRAGYATGMFGKWHLGEKGPHHPRRRGFDEAIVSMGRHFDFVTNPPVDHPRGQYLADFLTDRAVEFIGRHRDRPFFLYLPHFGVHAPHDAKPQLVARFKDKPAADGHHDPTYAAMIASIDVSVGRVVRALDEAGLTERTIVIFSSDNGGVGGYEREGLRDRGRKDVTDNAPLRSGKGSLYEGGIRVPLIVRWPGVTKPGTTCDEPSIHVDILPTCVEAAGATGPRQPLDGVSLVPLLHDPEARLGRDAIFSHFPGYLGIGVDRWRTTPVSVIQSGDWKLMEWLEDGRLELFNLRDDIGETTNRAAEMPAKAAELHARLVGWRAEVGAPMPRPNAPGIRDRPGPAGKGRGAKRGAGAAARRG